MSKDYAKYTSKNKRKRSRLPLIWISLIIVFLIAVFVFSAVYFEKGHIVAMIHHKPKIEATTPKAGNAPRFDFYTLLPSSNKVETTVVDKVQYMLQVASVRRIIDARQLKQQLQSIGFAVFIQKAKKSGEDWNRVNVGPYPSKAAAQADQARLEPVQNLLA